MWRSKFSRQLATVWWKQKRYTESHTSQNSTSQILPTDIVFSVPEGSHAHIQLQTDEGKFNHTLVTFSAVSLPFKDLKWTYAMVLILYPIVSAEEPKEKKNIPVWYGSSRGEVRKTLNCEKLSPLKDRFSVYLFLLPFRYSHPLRDAVSRGFPTSSVR